MKKLILTLTLVLAISGFAQATLTATVTDIHGNKLIYDDDYDITWYDFSYFTAGWDFAVRWAAALEVDLGGGVTIDDWRLPTAFNLDGSGPDAGFNIIGSEMGHLYYTELENVSSGPYGPSFSYVGSTKSGPFDTLDFGNYYWSDSGDPNYKWLLDFYNGEHRKREVMEWDDLTTLAVRSGKIEISGSDPVPEPGTLVLLSLGLAGIAAWRTKRSRL